MMNSICLFLFILSCFWDYGQSGNIESIVSKDNKNLKIEKQVRKVRGFLNNAFEANIGGVTSEYASAYYEERKAVNNERRGLYERDGHNIFQFDDGNPDIHGRIRRPCQVYDTFCIRKFFAEHSNCKISGRAIPDPLYRAQVGVNFATINVTEILVTSNYRGLNNARVSEFYINEVTDNLVIAVTFDSASKITTNTYFKYYLRGREPIVTEDFGVIQFGVLTVTVIIPHIKNLTLNNAEIYTYGDTNVYEFALGPRIAASSDPEVTSMYARFFTNVPVRYQEESSAQGDFIAGNYIQYNICDFGVKYL